MITESLLSSSLWRTCKRVAAFRGKHVAPDTAGPPGRGGLPGLHPLHRPLHLPPGQLTQRAAGQRQWQSCWCWCRCWRWGPTVVQSHQHRPGPARGGAGGQVEGAQKVSHELAGRTGGRQRSQHGGELGEGLVHRVVSVEVGQRHPVSPAGSRPARARLCQHRTPIHRARGLLQRGGGLAAALGPIALDRIGHGQVGEGDQHRHQHRRHHRHPHQPGQSGEGEGRDGAEGRGVDPPGLRVLLAALNRFPTFHSYRWCTGDSMEGKVAPPTRLQYHWITSSFFSSLLQLQLTRSSHRDVNTMQAFYLVCDISSSPAPPHSGYGWYEHTPRWSNGPRSDKAIDAVGSAALVFINLRPVPPTYNRRGRNWTKEWLNTANGQFSVPPACRQMK